MLSTQIAKAVYKHIHTFTPTDFDQLGITDADFELLTSVVPWRRADAQRILRTLNSIIFGALENLQMPKIVVPAEYVAPVVAFYVNPANIMASCIMLSQERMTGKGALEMASRAQVGSEVDSTSADQLFALCVCLMDVDVNQARRELYSKFGKALENAALDS